MQILDGKHGFNVTHSLYQSMLSRSSLGSITDCPTCKQGCRESLLSSKVGDLLGEVSTGVHRADRLPSNLNNACRHTHTHVVTMQP